VKGKKRAILFAVMLSVSMAFPSLAAEPAKGLADTIKKELSGIVFGPDTLKDISNGTEAGTVHGFTYEVASKGSMSYKFSASNPYIKVSGVFGSGLEVGENLSSIWMSSDGVRAFTCDQLKIGGKQYYMVLPVSSGKGTPSSGVEDLLDNFIKDMAASPTLDMAKRYAGYFAGFTWTASLMNDNFCLIKGKLGSCGYKTEAPKKDSAKANEYTFTHSGRYLDVTQSGSGTDLKALKLTAQKVAIKYDYTKIYTDEDPVWVVCSYSEKNPSGSVSVQKAFTNIKAAYLTAYNDEGRSEEEIKEESEQGYEDMDKGAESRTYDNSSFEGSSSVVNIDPMSYLADAELKASGANPGEAMMRDTLGSFYTLILVISISGLTISFIIGFLLISFGSVQARHSVASVLLQKVIVFFAICSVGSLLSNFLRIIGSFL